MRAPEDGEQGRSGGRTADLLKAAQKELVTGERRLARAYQDLSAAYRGGGATPGEGRLTRDHVLAYLAARLPATLAAVEAVLDSVAQLRSSWAPRSLLDIGTGPGTAAWAAASVFPSLSDATLVDRSSAMIDVGRRLAGRAEQPVLRDAVWQHEPVLATRAEPADLVTACYVLGELRERDATTAVARWWQATRAELVIVEPGTPEGFARILRSRTELLAAGATITAPCPADAACPMTGDDWCHFGRRVARSSVHRTVKGADLGFEDEKYAYVVASRQAPVHAAARVLRTPQVRSGHIRLTLCQAPARRDVVVARSQRAEYRWARHARWGDAVPAAVASPATRSGPDA